jgi:hypothetical protein
MAGPLGWRWCTHGGSPERMPNLSAHQPHRFSIAHGVINLPLLRLRGTPEDVRQGIQSLAARPHRSMQEQAR